MPPLCLLWPPISFHWAITVATTVPPFGDHTIHHSDGSASPLPPLHDLLCHYSSLGGSRNAQGSCCNSYTETEPFLFWATPERPGQFPGRPSIPTLAILCKAGLIGKTPYRKISWSVEAARLGFRLFQSLWNLTGTFSSSAAEMPVNFQSYMAIVTSIISRLRDFTTFGGLQDVLSLSK